MVGILYTKVEFNLISVQVCNKHYFSEHCPCACTTSHTAWKTLSSEPTQPVRKFIAITQWENPGGNLLIGIPWQRNFQEKGILLGLKPKLSNISQNETMGSNCCPNFTARCWLFAYSCGCCWCSNIAIQVNFLFNDLEVDAKTTPSHDRGQCRVQLHTERYLGGKSHFLNRTSDGRDWWKSLGHAQWVVFEFWTGVWQFSWQQFCTFLKLLVFAVVD